MRQSLLLGVLARSAGAPGWSAKARARMWHRLPRLNLSLRNWVKFSTAAKGTTTAVATGTVVAVGSGWLAAPVAHAAPVGGGLANATGRTPEWGSEHVGLRADWACIGANKASEDRLVVAAEGDGTVACVFDGHYGPRAAEFCRQNTPSYFAKAYNSVRDSTAYVDRFLALMEAGWTEYARVLVRRGDWSASLEGACALVAHVTAGKLVVGNLGDCRAVLIQEASDGKLEVRQLTREHNASRPEERSRIISEHQNEPDAVQYIAKSGSWYVKGTLQVTRAIGDLFLKDLWFSNSLPAHVKPYVGGELKSPPYVSVTPDVVQVGLTKSDKMLVIGSDGLWDELSNDEVLEALQGLIQSRAPPSGPGKSTVPPLPPGPDGLPTWRVRPELVEELAGERDNAAAVLLCRALSQNPVSARYGVSYILGLEPGSKRRQIHDDTSILVIWLQTP